MRRAILHIGAIKTGSTSIQRALAANRAQLLANGVAFAESPGGENHFALAVHAAPDRTPELWRLVGMEGDEEAFATRLRAALAAEMATMPPEVRTVIFSSEHCQLKIDRPEQVERLRALLAPHFSEVRVILYIRRQDQLVASAYNEHLKTGGTDRDIFARLHDRWLTALDYGRLAALWGEAFGRDNIVLRLFSRQEFVDGDLLSDFCAAAGIATLRPEVREVPEQNLSLRADAQRVLRCFNACFGVDFADETWRGRLRTAVLRRLRDNVTGQGCLPSQARARDFLRHFDMANERLRAEWFPAREAVFDADVARYPEQERHPPLWRDLVTVGLAMAGASVRSRRVARASGGAGRGRYLRAGITAPQLARNTSSAARTASGASSAR